MQQVQGVHLAGEIRILIPLRPAGDKADDAFDFVPAAGFRVLRWHPSHHDRILAVPGRPGCLD